MELNDTRREKLEEEAYAKIIWGEDRTEVVGHLVGAGMSKSEAQGVVKEALADRAQEVRKSGIRDMGIGIGGLLLSAILAGTYWMLAHIIYLKIMAILLIPAAYGIYHIIRGIPRLIMGSEQGAVSDLD